MYQRCVLSLTAFILLAVTAAGQGRASRPNFVGHSSPLGVSGRSAAPMVRAAPPFAVGFPSAIVVHNTHRGIRYLPRPVVIPSPFGFYSPFLAPAPIYTAPVYPVPPPYPPSAYYPAPANTALVYAEMLETPTVSQREVDLAFQIGRLTQEVEKLRQDQTLKQSQQTPTDNSPALQTPSTPTVLIFRDGQRREIQNYAVVGQTLWVLDEKNATPIALSDLNIDATRKENEQRGLHFLPAR